MILERYDQGWARFTEVHNEPAGPGDYRLIWTPEGPMARAINGGEPLEAEARALHDAIDRVGLRPNTWYVAQPVPWPEGVGFQVKRRRRFLICTETIVGGICVRNDRVARALRYEFGEG